MSNTGVDCERTRIDIINIIDNNSFGFLPEINENLTMQYCNYFDELIQYGNFEEIHCKTISGIGYEETQITLFKNNICDFSMNIYYSSSKYFICFDVSRDFLNNSQYMYIVDKIKEKTQESFEENYLNSLKK